ncbi:hypothetical protein AM608_09370 [Capnocytophaga sp. oral taxon 323]|nr:hypothetical protein AM608_09370 [Capnocytophaga sp. oral taxon 323]
MIDKIIKYSAQRLGIGQLPTFLRKRKMVAWLRSLLQPLESLHGSFITERADALYRLSHNGQVCYLEKVLNDKYDPERKRIYITDGNKHSRTYIYTRAEQRPKYLGKLFLQLRDAYADTGVDFIVKVPQELYKENDYEKMALIDYYRLASKRYRIEPF